MKSKTGYAPLLGDTRFEAFLWTQFLGAFNDNVYKMIVSIMAVDVAVGSAASSRYLALAGAVFVLPFLLFAGYSGQLADRFSKTRVLQVTKSFEIVIMLMGIAALVAGRIDGLLAVLFLLAVHSNFFSPAKYGILPEMMGEAQLSRANGLLELSTFIAIVVGTSFGTFLFERWRQQPVRMGVTLLAIALMGFLASLHIRKVPASGSTEPFHWNPFGEIVSGARDLLARKSLALSVLGISWFWFVGALFQLALILAAREVLHVPEGNVGFLVTALAVGIGAGSVIAGALSGDHIELGMVPMGSILMGICSIAFGLTRTYPAALAWLTGIGFAGGLFVVPLNAFLQERSGASEKGRILATNNFANMLGVILASGALWVLHDWLHWNASTIILALGIVIVAGTVYVTSVLPDLAVRFVLWCVVVVLFRVKVEGGERIPRQGPALLAANHISFADAVMVGYATPRIIRFLMWRPYFEHPVANVFFKILHAIPISANSPKETVRSIRRARQELENGELVGIFPEGHISLDGNMRGFERGFERIVNGTPVPIIPVHLDGLFGHPLSYKGGGLFHSWENVFRPLVRVRVGAPVYGDISPDELRQLILNLADGRN